MISIALYLLVFVINLRLQMKYGKVHAIILLFLVAGLCLTLLNLLLNFDNPVPFADISDAQSYLLYGERTAGNLMLLIERDYQYWGYILVLSLLYITSFGNWFLYVFSATLLNFVLFGALFTVLVIWSRKLFGLEVPSLFWYLVIFNPSVPLVALATTRDTFITFFTVLFLICMVNFLCRGFGLKGITLFLFSGFSLYFFRTSFVYLLSMTFVVTLFLSFLVKKRLWLFAVFVMVAYFFVLIVAPIRFVRPLVVLTGRDMEYVSSLTILGEEAVMSVTQAYSADKNELVRVAALRAIGRGPITFLGRSYLKGMYLNLGGFSTGFYESNILKVVLNIFKDLYRYWIVLPLIFFIVFTKRITDLGAKKWLVLLTLTSYLFALLMYSSKFGNWQTRNRLPLEILLVFGLLLVISDSSSVKIHKYIPFWLISNFLAFLYIILKPF